MESKKVQLIAALGFEWSKRGVKLGDITRCRRRTSFRTSFRYKQRFFTIMYAYRLQFKALKRQSLKNYNFSVFMSAPTLNSRKVHVYDEITCLKIKL